ncbi:MAG: carboxypeptidase-like regulatory domain-containing protein, partial [Planctomycetes bacterium]|nr:carboxypeptidase-like regulatory domain-containing protein [Planctomycetota bacterium]
MRPTALAALLIILAALAWLALSAPPQDSNGTTGSTPEAPQESNPANAATAGSSAATHENGEGEREKVAPAPQAQHTATVRLQLLNQQNEPVANAFAVMGHLGTFRSHFGETNSATSPLEPKHLAESTGDISITLDPERHSRALVIGGENWVPIEIEIDLLTSGEQRDLGVFHLTPGLRAHGIVRTPHGEPVVGAEVFLQEQGNNPFGSRFGGGGGRKTLSNEQGRWAFWGLQPGSWAVEVRAAGYVTHHGNSFSLRHATTSPEQTIQLDAGATFTGRVLDEQGAPISGAKLLAYSSQKSQQGLVFGGEWAESPTFDQVMESSVTTDAAGKIVMAGLSGTGSDAIAAAAPHYSLQTLDPLVPSSEILLHLDPCFTLQGKVVDLAGQPVPAIEVQLHNQDNNIQAWGIPPERVDTDGHGRFSFDRVEQGEYRVVVDSAAGEGELKVEVDQQPDELLLPIGGEPNLTLTLTDQNGTPLGGADVFARQDSDGSSVLLSPVSNPEHLKQMRGNWSQRSKTNDQGIALLRGAKGALHLSLSAEGYADKSVKLDMEQGEPQAHNYQMVAGGHLRVLVVDANQSPVARTPLQILREDDQESSYTESPYT